MEVLNVTVAQVSKRWGKSVSLSSRKLNGISPMTLDDAETLQEILNISDGDFGSYFFRDAY